MENNKAYWIFFIIMIMMSASCMAGSFVDDTSTEFDLGTYNWTAWKISDVVLSGELPDAGVNSAVDTTGLVGLWHFNGDATDTSGNNNHGTINGATTGADGKLDTAMSFDGVGDYISVADSDSFTINTTITYSAWIKRNNNQFWLWFKMDSYGAGDPRNGLGFHVDSSNKAVASFGQVGYHNIITSTSEIDTNWNLITFTRNGTIAKIYINGILDKTQGFGQSSWLGSSYRDPTIGQGTWGRNPFNGTIDEVAIYNRALSADEIQAIYNAQKDNYPPSGDYESNIFDAGSSVAWDNLTWAASGAGELPDNQGVESGEHGANMTGNVLLMHMDETTGTIVDSSGNGNDGAAYGGVTYQADGKFDKALSFDGVDGYVDLPNIAWGPAYTIEAWIYTIESGEGSRQGIIGLCDDPDTTCSGANYKIAMFGIDESDQLHSLFSPTVASIRRLQGRTDVGIVNINEWHHVATTIDSNTNTIKIYLDGIEQSITETITGSGSESFSAVSGIGSRWHVYDSSHYNFFNGSIDEIAIWNRSLSPDEILDHYKRGALRLNISVKSCNDASCDGETTWDKTCTTSPCDITTLTISQYLQYKVDMQADGSSTPELGSVSMFYGAAGCTDNDGDGWGAVGSNLILCNYSGSYDCNDSNIDVHPNAYDLPNNGIDEDCSGTDATANYSATISFELDYNIDGFWGYHIGDDIGYEINFFKNNALSNEDVNNIVVNLTNVNGETLKSHSISYMDHPGTGNWTGTFLTDDIAAQYDDKVQLKVFVYNSGSDLIAWRTHQDEVFDLGTAAIQSVSSSLYTYLTNAISNYTVKDLVINSSYAKVNWTGSTLNLAERIIPLDSAITIDDRLVHVDSASYSELNDSATLTFENVNCASPYVFYSETESTRATILAENNQCHPPRCTNIQCSAGTLTVTVSSFSGYAAEGNANLSIDADDPKLDTELMHFSAEYRNSTTGGNFISGADCQIYFTDGNYPMVEGSNVYTYNRTFIGFGAGIQEYNVTCNHTTWTPLAAFDNATTTSAVIPEFSTITLGLGLIAVLAGLFVIRRKK